jgi:hypothetical protein
MSTSAFVIGRPQPGEAGDFYLRYIDRVKGDDPLAFLEEQAEEALALLGKVSEDRSLYRYAPDKWSLRQVLSHVNDSERIFTGRALWFARGLGDPLPGFDQDVSVAAAGADQVSWARHLEEFAAIRRASIAFFRNLPSEAWMRRGIASDNPFTVRALAYIVPGHVAHHLAVVRERYS